MLAEFWHYGKVFYVKDLIYCLEQSGFGFPISQMKKLKYKAVKNLPKATELVNTEAINEGTHPNSKVYVF